MPISDYDLSDPILTYPASKHRVVPPPPTTEQIEAAREFLRRYPAPYLPRPGYKQWAVTAHGRARHILWVLHNPGVMHWDTIEGGPRPS